MFGTKRFGRNLSNVQRDNQMPGKQLPAAKKQCLAPVQTRNTFVAPTQHRMREKPAKAVVPAKSKPTQTKPAFVFTETTLPSVEDEYSSENEMEVDSMSIDSITPEPFEDIDRYDTHDPQFVSEYINDIMEFLKEKELAVQISDNYCDRQKEIKPRQRNQLVKWIAEVYVQLKLLSETYFLAVNIVDQVLESAMLPKKKLHLTGVTALFIASKYEETWAPPINDLRICCDFAYSEEDIMRMERDILNRIDFNLCIPAPIHFLRRYSKAGHSDGLTHTIAKFLTEMTCQNYVMLKFLPSEIAGASVLLARQISGSYEELWDHNLCHYSGYEMEDLIECGQTLTKVIYREITSEKGPGAIIRKYSEKKLLGVSNLVATALCK